MKNRHHRKFPSSPRGTVCLTRRVGIVVAIGFAIGTALPVLAYNSDETGAEAAGRSEADNREDALAAKVALLVRRFGDDDAAVRDNAERELLALAAGDNGRDREQVFNDLPAVDSQMPPDVRHRLTRIRQTLARAIAEAAVAPTTVTLDADKMTLTNVFAAIALQTGNQIDPPGEDDGPPMGNEPRLTLSVKDEPFWKAFDAVLDEAELDVYAFSGEDAISVVPRGAAVRPRSKGACYAGPFRLAATEIFARRDLRRDEQDSLRVTLEIAWEPRLRPIRIALPLADFVATDDAGERVNTLDAEGELESPVQGGTQATELQIPLALPQRSVQSIASLRGKLTALVPGRTETFRFEDLSKTGKGEQRRGGVIVVLDRVRKNNEIWEIHMRVRFDKASDALASHFDWVMLNSTYLEDAAGEPIDHVGFETTIQTPEEIGLAYLFELPEDRKDLLGLKWVYQTPAAIIELPIDFELKDLALP